MGKDNQLVFQLELTNHLHNHSTLADGTKEYYDCVDDLLTPIGIPTGYPLIEPTYNWEEISKTPWGLDDDFNEQTMDPSTCAPFDPDINIIPLKMYRADGTFV